MQSLVATRSELLDRRRRAVFVSQGRDLLKDKRTALVREFRHHQSDLLDGLQQLRCLAGQARQRLVEATAACGPEPFASAALAAATEVGVASSDALAEDEPVLLWNRPGWQPFQQLVGFLSWPARGGLDPTGLVDMVPTVPGWSDRADGES